MSDKGGHFTKDPSLGKILMFTEPSVTLSNYLVMNVYSSLDEAYLRKVTHLKTFK